MSYTFGSYDLETDLGIHIKSISGALDFPKRKDKAEYDWGRDTDGVEAFTDEEDIMWNPRDIVLQCYIIADTEAEFRNALAEAVSNLTDVGTHDFTTTYLSDTYSVYLRNRADMDRITKWNAVKNAGSFKLVFHEADPQYPAIWRDMAGHWTLKQTDESGGDQTDQAGTNDMTIVNTAYTTDRDGNATEAIKFNGTDAYGDCNNSYESTFQDEFSISFWCEPDDGQPVAQEYLCGTEDATPDNKVSISITTAGKIEAVYEADTDSVTALTNAAAFSNGAESWHHIVVTVDADNIKIYFDGSEQTLDSGSDGDMSIVTMSEYSNSNDMFIGARNDNGADAGHFAGDMKNFRIYQRKLTQTEISVLSHTNNDRLDI